MKKIKILALVLACLMLVSVFAACGDDPNKPTDETTKAPDETTKAPDESTEPNAETTETTPAESEEDPVEEIPTIEEKNYNNHDFVVIWPDEHPQGHWMHNEIDCDQMGSDRINNAVYKRNQKIELDYNITIASVGMWCGDIPKTMRSQALSEAPDYQAFFDNLGIKAVNTIAVEGVLADWNDAPYYNESMPWWDHKLMEDYSLGGSRYYALGDIIYSDNFYPYIVYYNKDMLDIYGIEDNFADLVDAKEWTIDKLIALCKNVSMSDDDIWDGNDTYGCLVSDTVVRALYYGFGKDVVKNDKDGYPEWVMTPAAVATVAPKINDFFNSNDHICANTNLFENATDEAHADISRKMFMNNQGLFTIGELIFAERLLNNENTVKFGILPMPLLDNKQADYVCVLNDATVLGIPATQDDGTFLSRTSHILSAMSRESMDTLTPAFTEVFLKAKYLPGNDAVDMYEKITGTLKAQDVATRLGYGNNMFGQFIDMIVSGSTDFNSIYTKNIDKAEEELDKLREDIELSKMGLG